MRKSKTVKIQLDNGDSKEEKFQEFTLNELSIKSIINLSQNNAFFGDSKGDPDPDIKKDENGKEPAPTNAGTTLFQEFSGMGKDVGAIITETCDFELKDLIDLYPSEIQELFEAFQEVNQVFLGVLRKLKILDAFLRIAERAFNNFSEMLAI